MTKKQDAAIKPKGFSLIDLLLAMVISATILIGVYKVFLSNLQTTYSQLDITSLDANTRKFIQLMYSDISDVNGNLIRGIPTVYPLFVGNEINGFILFKAEKKLPLFKINSNLFVPPAWGPGNHEDVDVHPAGGIPSINEKKLKAGRFAILYNFGNYAWIPYKITNASKMQDGPPPVYRLSLETLATPNDHWFNDLATPNCENFRASEIEQDIEQACASGAYQQLNTAFIIADVIEYEFTKDNGKIERVVNRTGIGGEDFISKTVAVPNVIEFSQSFKTQRNLLYPGQPRTIKNKEQIRTEFINNLIPDNYPAQDVDADDCPIHLNYICKTDPLTLNPLAYGYFSSMINTLNFDLTIQSENPSKTAKGNKKQKRKVAFQINLDENHGNNALTAFTSQKLVVTKDSSQGIKPYSALMSTPKIYKDPMGGNAMSPFFTAAAPMVSVPTENSDPVNDNKLYNICQSCPGGPGNCPGTYPFQCNLDRNKNGTLDYLDCKNGDAAARDSALCLKPEGTINDKELPGGSQIDPQLVLLGNEAEILNRFDLSKECDMGYPCPLANYYSSSPLTDTIFPLTMATLTDPFGNPREFYIGLARHRTVWSSPVHRYYPYYLSTIVAVDPTQDPPTSKVIRSVPSNPFDELRWKDEISTYPDTAQVSKLQMVYLNDSGGSRVEERLVWSDHSTNSIFMRKRQYGQDDNQWSPPIEVLKDETLNPYKYAIKTEEYYWGDTKAEMAAYPNSQWNATPKYEHPRITSFRVLNDGKTIVYCTAQTKLDEIINEPTDDGLHMWFYKNEVKYARPIERPDEPGKIYTCNPNPNALPEESWDNPKCTMPAGTPKPIDFAWCASGGAGGSDPRDTCWRDPATGERPLDFPVGYVQPDYSAKLKVAIKNETTGEYTTKTLANIHGDCKDIADGPDGNLYISSKYNMKVVNLDELLHKLTLAEANPNNPLASPPNIDLAYRKGDKKPYSANNILNEIVDPTSDTAHDIQDGTYDIALTNLSGIDIWENAKMLNLVFTDSFNRIYGYIIRERNRKAKEFVGQIIESESGDRNLDNTAIYKKNDVDIGPELASWLLPNNPTKVWGEREVLVNGKARYGIPLRIPLRGPTTVTNYPDGLPDSGVEFLGGVHTRMLPHDNLSFCYVDPKDPIVSTMTRCGQDPTFRQCGIDILHEVGATREGVHVGFTGCGRALQSMDDPDVLIPEE